MNSINTTNQSTWLWFFDAWVNLASSGVSATTVAFVCG